MHFSGKISEIENSGFINSHNHMWIFRNRVKGRALDMIDEPTTLITLAWACQLSPF